MTVKELRERLQTFEQEKFGNAELPVMSFDNENGYVEVTQVEFRPGTIDSKFSHCFLKWY